MACAGRQEPGEQAREPLSALTFGQQLLHLVQATKSLEKKGKRLENLNVSAGGKRKRQEGTADRKK